MVWYYTYYTKFEIIFIMKKMSVFGVGPRIYIGTAIFAAPVIWVNKIYFSRLKLVIVSPAFTFFLGFILATAGAVFLLWSMAVLWKNYSKNKLATTGPSMKCKLEPMA